MKSTLLFTVLYFLFLSQAGDVFAQEKDSIRIKVIREVNGERKTIDRTYKSREEMMKDPELKALQINGDSTFLIMRSGEGNFSWTTDSTDQAFIVIDKMMNTDGRRNMVITTEEAITIDGSGKHFIMKADSLDSNVFVFRTKGESGDGKQMSWVTKESPGEFRFFGMRRQMFINDAQDSELQSAGIEPRKELGPESATFRIDTGNNSLDVSVELPKGDLLVQLISEEGGQIFSE